MSDKDLQFIERALAHPWMFWAYFWKWPRIVRQACAEYDLLARERDTAKAAYERSERANKLVRDWIHVTHRLSTTPEAIRAIFAAGKRLSILLVFLVATNAFGQAPPYLRNQWTTNANPIAVKVISTNGVQAATNVWALDFTNTASVSVNVVSNAGKVVFSFIGATNSGGSSSLTNALLHAGPTNGSVDALILTAGNGVTLTTSGTNRVAAIDTNVVAEISDLLWTNVPSGWPNTSDILTPVQRYGTFQFATNKQGAFIKSLFAVGTPVAPISSLITNSGSIIALGDGAMAGATLNGNSEAFVALGYNALKNFTGHSVEDFFAMGVNIADSAVLTNVNEVFANGDFALEGARIQQANGLRTFGGYTLSSAAISNANYITAIGNATMGFQATGVQFSNVLEIVAVGDNAMKQAWLFNCEKINAFGADALRSARLTDCTNLTFLGNFSGTNLVLVSKTNIVAVGNIRDAVPDNGEFWLGNTGNVYRMPGNIGTIRGVSGYSWPTAHAAGVWTNDGIGGTGWKPLSDFISGGGGIASIFTNNVLAGGPGLTELEFTNTATVTWTATTNAGRVTMSATASGGSQTPWTSNIDADAFSLTDFGSQLAFTNGSKIGATAINTLSLTNAHLVFSADNTFDIGASGANRPRNIYAGGSMTLAGGLTVQGATLINNNLTFGAGNALFSNGKAQLYSPASGIWALYNSTGSDFDRLQFGGATAPFPALKRSAGHLSMVDAAGSNSTNSFIFGNTVDTTASTGMTMNRQTGRVRLSAGNQTYLVTNNLATANSIVTATVNSDDANALSVKAIPTAGLITLKVNAATAANTDISFFISAP